MLLMEQKTTLYSKMVILAMTETEVMTIFSFLMMMTMKKSFLDLKVIKVLFYNNLCFSLNLCFFLFLLYFLLYSIACRSIIEMYYAQNSLLFVNFS